MPPGEVPGMEHTGTYLMAAGKQSTGQGWTGIGWGGWSAAKATENDDVSLELRSPERVLDIFMGFIAMTRREVKTTCFKGETISLKVVI